MKVQIENVSFSYDQQPTLKNIDLTVEPGTLLALVGPNGSGKSTLLNLISGLLKPSQGHIYLDAVPLEQFKPQQLSQKLAALEQEHPVSFDFTVQEVIQWGRIPHRSRFSPWTDHDEHIARNVMQTTKTMSLAQRSIRDLSGGERQRAFIAMALAQEPQLLLLDEPTAHLDLKHQFEILELARQLTQQGMTLIMAIHDLHLAAQYADQMAILNEGELVQHGPPTSVLTEETIKAVWNISSKIVHKNGAFYIFPRHLQP